MHSFNGKSCNIHYNSDLSGELIIELQDELEMYLNPPRMKVLAEDILNFVAEFVKGEKIGQLEQMEPREILGIK